VHEMEDGREVERLAAMEVDEALEVLWPRLQELTGVLAADAVAGSGAAGDLV
jgi:hypothetical protein